MQVRSFGSVVIAAAMLTGGSSAVLAEGDVHWSYEGESGPENWGELADAFALCADGTQQTPIDITDADVVALPDPVIEYAAGPVQFNNNGHTVVAGAAAGNTLTVDGESSRLLQMHYHAPAEHDIAAAEGAAEVHFVHANLQDGLSVVGVVIVEGEENAAWAPYIEALVVNEEEILEGTLDWAALLPESRATFRYSGSLTTPPCSEGEDWYVMTEPIEMSTEQIAALSEVFGETDRPVQPQGDREVVLDLSDR